MNMYAEQLTLVPPFGLEKPEGMQGEVTTYTDPETQLSLDTYAVDRRHGDSRNTVMVFQPWSDYVARPFAQQRMDLIADNLNARVIGVDNLGVGMGTSDIPQEMRREIAGGDFGKVSELQWEAVQANELFDKDDSLTLSYYSLGTTMAMSMAAHAPEGVSIDRMILWDCAAIEPQHFGRLALTYLTDGGKGWKQYLSENPDWVKKPSGIGHLVKRIAAQPAGHIDYPRGMAQKTAFDDMVMAHEKGVMSNDSVVHILNGSKSKVSPTELNDKLAAQIAGLKLPTPEVIRTTLVGERHAIQDSFPRTVCVLGHIARQHSQLTNQ